MMQFNSQWVGVIHEWTVRFYHELDYLREARNAMIFKEQMEELDGITAPHVYTNFCSQQVLTTAWVEGGCPAILHTNKFLQYFL